MRGSLDKLAEGCELTEQEWKFLIAGSYDRNLLYARADEVRRKHYGTDVYIRGLIEITSYCRNDCFYWQDKMREYQGQTVSFIRGGDTGLL